MHINSELASWIKISQIRGLSYDLVFNLLRSIGAPSLILNSPQDVLQQHVSIKVAKEIKAVVSDDIDHILASWLEDPLNHIVTLVDSNYPQALLNIPDPPILLYVKGRLDILNHPCIAVVGSRNASVQGLRNAEAFAKSLSDCGLCVVSGMAHGIDAAAHLGGLQGLGSSIAVVGTGLDKVYPSANRELAHQLATSGVLISEYPLGTPPLPHNFPRRNRIISGLSLGCLVVEASLQSGSLITARLALEQGKEVFAIPGSIHSPQTKGCHSLIKQGAKLVETHADILEELNIDKIKVINTLNSDFEDSIFSFMGFEPVNIDHLCQHSGLTVEDLSAILLQMELDGKVAVLPGGLYQRIV